VTDPAGVLAGLQAEIARVLTPFAKPEHRRFEPHLTLARIKARTPSPVGMSISKLVAQWDGGPQPWHVERFALMQSHMDSAGARHLVVQRFGPQE
jgi:2'-5' RNA ligase